MILLFPLRSVYLSLITQLFWKKKYTDNEKQAVLLGIKQTWNWFAHLICMIFHKNENLFSNFAIKIAFCFSFLNMFCHHAERSPAGGGEQERWWDKSTMKIMPFIGAEIEIVLGTLGCSWNIAPFYFQGDAFMMVNFLKMQILTYHKLTLSLTVFI